MQEEGSKWETEREKRRVKKRSPVFKNGGERKEKTKKGVCSRISLGRNARGSE